MEQVKHRAGATLRAQLLWALIPPMLGVVVAGGAAAYSLAWRSATEAYDIGLFDSARSLAQQINLDAAQRPSLVLPDAARDILLSDPYDRVFFRVVDADRRTVAGNPAIPLPSTLPSQDNPIVFSNALIASERVRVATYGVFAGAAPVATVLFAETLVKRQRLSQRLLWTVVLPLVLVVLIVMSIVWIAVRRGLAPLGRLASAIGRRGWGDLRPVRHEPAPEEVRPLLEALNDLIERLSAAHSAQQRFISEAAHQLRTPLAALSAQVERTLLARDFDSIRPALGQIQSSSRRVIRLVNQLLTLARAEPGNDPRHELTLLDFGKVVQETCREWVPDALARGVDLGFAGDAASCTILGHEALLTEMLNNLIDNALRYGAPSGGTVTIRLRCAPTPELSVEDDGPGIPTSERERIFERFHRLPGSAQGGSGLGLAIVREIVALHSAQVVVESGSRGRGALFRVRFPAPASELTLAAASRDADESKQKGSSR